MKSTQTEISKAILADERSCDNVLRARTVDIERFVLADLSGLNLSKTAGLFRLSALSCSVIPEICLIHNTARFIVGYARSMQLLHEQYGLSLRDFSLTSYSLIAVPWRLC